VDKTNSQNVPSTTNIDEFNSLLHRLKIIKILGLALFGLKISALSICEVLALALTATICLSCLVIAPPGREISRYTRIFDIFIGKTLDEDKAEPISNSCSDISRDPINQQQTIQSNLSIPSVESKISNIPININYSLLTDEEILSMIKSKQLSVHNLEKYFPLLKAIYIRRLLLNEQIISTKNSSFSLDLLPYEHYDYSLVINQCCENVIGYVQLPVGYAGPLRIDNKYFYIPMATTEGILFFLKDQIFQFDFFKVHLLQVRIVDVKR
jgi:hypothetical protein